MATHLATLCTGKGQPFEVQRRPTPKPGPGELLVAVKSVAINPADYIMRDSGLFISSYPTVIGIDIAGLVLEVGADVPTGASEGTSGLSFQPGVTRIAAYSGSVWKGCNPDYGIFQERCLIPWQHAVPLPDDTMTWNQAATLPVAVQVPLSVWDAFKIPRVLDTPSSAPKEAMLIWGASSCVGSMGVQCARLLRDNPNSAFDAVYAVSGLANHEYVASLGAERVFDYKDPDVVEAIISAAKTDGLVVRHCFLATGELARCQGVLKAFLGDDAGAGKPTAMIGSAPPVPADAEVIDGLEVIFVQPSHEEGERLEQNRYWLGTWLRENLAKKTIRPSPELKVVGKGLECINTALDLQREGVSCTKLVVEIEG